MRLSTNIDTAPTNTRQIISADKNGYRRYCLQNATFVVEHENIDDIYKVVQISAMR